MTEGSLKAASDTRWEAHRHYADIHYVINGVEDIGVGRLGGESPVVAYDAAKDIAFYRLAGKFYVSEGFSYFVFFPGRDAHQPGVSVAGLSGSSAVEGAVVKRLVIKVRTDEGDAAR